jgi:hypothetical protein
MISYRYNVLTFARTTDLRQRLGFIFDIFSCHLTKQTNQLPSKDITSGTVLHLHIVSSLFLEEAVCRYLMHFTVSTCRDEPLMCDISHAVSSPLVIDLIPFGFRHSAFGKGIQLWVLSKTVCGGRGAISGGL